MPSTLSRVTRLLACAAAAGAASAGKLTLLLDGKPVTPGNYTVTPTTTLSFDNELVTFTFGHTGGRSEFRIEQVLVAGTQIADNADDSWYIDWSGDKAPGEHAEWDTLQVLRADADLLHVAFVDSGNKLLRHTLHNVMAPDTRGMFGFDVMTTMDRTTLNEVRFNTRWARCTLNHAYSGERGVGQMPTYAYLYTQKKIQDETWQVNGTNAPGLPCPADNGGGLPAGYTYTKYDWVLYHHENPIWGHWGASDDGSSLIGMWFTPLGGVTNTTSAATYGVGPQHQDLALHQDGLVLNYMSANHFGLPGYPVPSGYTRLYGPWLLHASVVDATAGPDDLVADGEAAAAAAIAQSLNGLPFIQHPLYPQADGRATVTGTVVVSDGRPAGGLWALLCTQAEPEVFLLRENTYFVPTNDDGTFALPGVPFGNYSLYVFSSSGGLIPGLLRVDGVLVTNADGSGTVDLGAVAWTPADAGRTHLWQIGFADRQGGEFALGGSKREWLLPGSIPGDLTYTVGTSVDGADWYYAQTQGGTWTVSFDLPTSYAGTAYLRLGASLTQGDSPAVAINGRAIDGAAPTGSDSTLSRQAIRSGYYRDVESTFDATLLVAGKNTLTFERPPVPGGSNNTGMGYDAVILTVLTPEGAATATAGGALRGGAGAPVAALRVAGAAVVSGGGSASLRLTVANDGRAHAMDVRVTAVSFGGRNVLPHHVPVAAYVTTGGGTATVDVRLPPGTTTGGSATVTLLADGGRTRTTATLPL